MNCEYNKRFLIYKKFNLKYFFIFVAENGVGASQTTMIGCQMS